MLHLLLQQVVLIRVKTNLCSTVYLCFSDPSLFLTNNEDFFWKNFTDIKLSKTPKMLIEPDGRRLVPQEQRYLLFQKRKILGGTIAKAFPLPESFFSFFSVSCSLVELAA